MADLPSGSITFLFTDIEGSTQLLKRLRERYSEVLSDHQRLLRGAFVAHGGHEVDTGWRLVPELAKAYPRASADRKTWKFVIVAVGCARPSSASRGSSPLPC